MRFKQVVAGVDPTRMRNITMLAAGLLALASCGSGPSQPTTITATTTPVATVAPQEPPPGQAVELAAEQLAEGYSFSGVVTVRGVETTVEGWVAGEDRTVTTRVGDDEMTTSVVAGIATEDRDGVVVEVPLLEAAEAPSPAILALLRDVTETDDGIQGKLNGSAVGGLGYDVNGSASVLAQTSEDGTLTAYEISANNGSWSIVMAFTTR